MNPNSYLLTLYIEESSPPPIKKSWHSKNAQDRAPWNSIFESITTFFCDSHTFRKDFRCVININGIFIDLQGDVLRYLAPNMRSIASLIDKAYKKGMELQEGQRSASTPGIWVTRIEPELPDKRYSLVLGEKSANIIEYPAVIIQKSGYPLLSIPGHTLSQGLVWLKYNR
ncbi:MAG: hypothetical protein INQ03_07545 [Candidatus Heimdallarchaeota archaeon]|nr:hypothetical protein [Candidatus Heimdallarchaeota archaeon]